MGKLHQHFCTCTESVTDLYLQRESWLFLSHFWLPSNWDVDFNAAEAVAKFGLSFKPNDHEQI